MVPFAVYSAFETFQFHVQDGGSAQDVNNSKFAPKPGKNGAKIKSFPVFCLERLVLDRIDGNSEIQNCLDWLKFVDFIFLAALTVRRNREMKLTSKLHFKSQGASCRKLNSV